MSLMSTDEYVIHEYVIINTHTIDYDNSGTAQQWGEDGHLIKY